MKLTYRIAICFLAVLMPVAALAQGSAPSLSVAPIPTVVAARGSKAALSVEMQVNRGFHVNSNKPLDELLMPTVVHLNPPEGIMIMNVKYPEAELLALPFMGNDKLSVYSGHFVVTAEVRIPKAAPLGTQRVRGEVKYQACDNRQCFPPKSTALEFDVKVVRGAAKKTSTYTPASPHIH
jgi:hypothetical protein